MQDASPYFAIDSTGGLVLKKSLDFESLPPHQEVMVNTSGVSDGSKHASYAQKEDKLLLLVLVAKVRSLNFIH